MVVLWHKIVLSPPAWFLVEIFAKKPWKWSLYRSSAFASFLPIRTLTGWQCSHWDRSCPAYRSFLVRVVSFLSSVAILLPAAFALTFFTYLIYKCVAAAFRALRWIVALLKIIFGWIKREATSVCMWVSKVINKLCFWQNTTTNTNSKVRSREAHRTQKESWTLQKKAKGLGGLAKRNTRGRVY